MEFEKKKTNKLKIKLIMKKLFLLLAIAATMAACKTEEPKAFQIKDTDMISIRPASGTAMKVKSIDSTHLSALEIVKQTTEISLLDTLGGKWGRSFSAEQRDTLSTTPKLLMWATDVISLDGNLQAGFLGNFSQAKNVLFLRYDSRYISYNPATWIYCDTIAYIPNSVLRTAETAIISAYETKNIEECYRIFNEAYTFTPITGAEWRALKAAGQN